MHSDSIANVALLLTIVLVTAKVGGEIASRLKQAPVLGELLGGMIIGNISLPILQSLHADPFIDMFARLGVLILLFEVGLESTVGEVLSVGASAIRVALLGTLGSFVAGFAVAKLLSPHSPLPVHVFIALTICATSIGITARVLKDLGKARTKEAKTILGAAIMDDIIGLVILALAAGWISSREAGTETSVLSFVFLFLKTVGLLAIAIAIGVRVTPRIFAFAATLRTSGVLLSVGLAFCFSFAWASEKMGLAPIVGAYAAGLVLEDLHSAKFVARGEKSLTELIEPISHFFVPIFFVIMGVRVDIGAFRDPHTIALAVALSIAAVAGKLACSLGVARGVSGLTVAIGMMPRGEVTLIFAGMGMSLTIGGQPILDKGAYSAIVIAVILTTLVAPVGLKWSFTRATSSAAEARG